ncbi:MAG: hypothetical protein SFU25_11755 [Candidatus Caenarcaniphilales bacterium]|nr:hypothetical protein [Candidatus Caenarcaniphilales bacterium]
MPPMVAVSINGSTAGGTYYNSALGPSKFDYEMTLSDLVSFNTPGRVNKTTPDYIINGAVYNNCNSSGRCVGSSRVYVDVIPTKVSMTYLTNKVDVNLTGQIGNRTLNSSGRATNITFASSLAILSLPWRANVIINGFIDPATPNNLPPASYTGVFTVQITIP